MITSVAGPYPSSGSKRVVIARTESGELYTVGPVFTQVGIAHLEARVRATGAEVLGIARAYSRSEFRAMPR